MVQIISLLGSVNGGSEIFDFSKESFSGDPPHGPNYKLAWKR